MLLVLEDPNLNALGRSLLLYYSSCQSLGVSDALMVANYN